MYKIEAYQCDYCKKYGKSKSHIKKHEGECYHNPVTKACATCANLTQEMYKVDKQNLYFPYEGDVYDSIPKCMFGKSISSITDGKKVVNLQSNCDCWVEEEQNEEDE